MFTHLKNIETAFRHIKLFSYLLIGACTAISCFALYKSYQAADLAQSHIYILANGKALEAVAADRKDNIPVEARDHIRMFHHYFFTLDPDEKVIDGNIGKALYLADESARNQYNNLKEKGYYNNLISGNISQHISVDSIQLDMDRYPYFFKCYATEKLIRSSSTVNRSLVTQGFLRNVSRSDNNPHGFLIQQWETLANRDTTIQQEQP
ncbi:conjugative transposon protein TraK [Mucilaginibacter segetis]|uniref:Conjugative transposon protein TraK n=1 Tax=Mucilaginibacter segetis TaxID=2793071 RepID=A0A934PT25_9SPHI|nr:conjugative transposon protein TraK [Mucilaginibacter segetis]MBK0378530.1 conjugative transposon protein TraK [Mucilaginibacter segetis]